MLVSSWCRDGGATNISSVRAKPTPHSNTRTQSLTAGSSGQLPRPRLPPPWPLGQPTSPRPLVGTCATACHGLSRQSRPSGRHKARRCHSPVGVGAVLRCKADAVGVKGREAPPPLSRRMEMGWESCGGGGWGWGGWVGWGSQARGGKPGRSLHPCCRGGAMAPSSTYPSLLHHDTPLYVLLGNDKLRGYPAGG